MRLLFLSPFFFSIDLLSLPSVQPGRKANALSCTRAVSIQVPISIPLCDKFMLLTDLYLQTAIPIPTPRRAATSKRTYESTRHFTRQECLRRNFSINSTRSQFHAGDGEEEGTGGEGEGEGESPGVTAIANRNSISLSPRCARAVTLLLSSPPRYFLLTAVFIGAYRMY